MSDNTTFTVHHPFPTFEFYGRLNGGQFAELPLDSADAPIWNGKYSTVVTGATITLTFSGVTTDDVGEFYFRAVSPDPGRSIDSDVKQLTVGDLEFEYSPSNQIISLFTGGKTYYVSIAGDEGNDGLSDQTPIPASAVADRVEYGDTVLFKNDEVHELYEYPVSFSKEGVTYDGRTWGSGTRCTLRAMAFRGSGQSDAIITVRYSNVTWRGFEVDGNDQSVFGIHIGAGLEGESIDDSYDFGGTTLDDVYVHKIGIPGDGSASGKGIYGVLVAVKTGEPTTTISNTTIINSEISNNCSEGIALYQSWDTNNTKRYNRTDGVLVQNCKIRDNGRRSGISRGHGILVCNNTDNVTIEHTEISNNEVYGIYVRTSNPYANPFEVSIGAPNNLIIRNNIITGSGVDGILLIAGSNNFDVDAKIYNNLVFDNGRMEIAVITVGTGPKIYEITGNTLFKTDIPGNKGLLGVDVFTLAEGKTPVTVILNNNLIVGHGGYLIRDDYKRLEGTAGNHLYRSDGGSLVLTDRYYNDSNIHEWEPTAVTGDPILKGGVLPSGFAGTLGQDMRPDTDFFDISGAGVDAAQPLSAEYNGAINHSGTADAATNIRPIGSGWDSGAYEHLEAVSINPDAQQVVDNFAAAGLALNPGSQLDAVVAFVTALSEEGTWASIDDIVIHCFQPTYGEPDLNKNVFSWRQGITGVIANDADKEQYWTNNGAGLSYYAGNSRPPPMTLGYEFSDLPLFSGDIESALVGAYYVGDEGTANPGAMDLVGVTNGSTTAVMVIPYYASSALGNVCHYRTANPHAGVGYESQHTMLLAYAAGPSEDKLYANGVETTAPVYNARVIPTGEIWAGAVHSTSSGNCRHALRVGKNAGCVFGTSVGFNNALFTSEIEKLLVALGKDPAP